MILGELPIRAADMALQVSGSFCLQSWFIIHQRLATLLMRENAAAFRHTQPYTAREHDIAELVAATARSQ
jgi:hypothetical protein